VEYEDERDEGERDDSEMYEEYEEAGHRGYGGGQGGFVGGISMMNTKAKARPEFKIIQDKDRKIHPDVCSELKYKLREYFRLNVVIVKSKSAESHLVVKSKSKSKSAESHLRDDTYIDNLCNYSMLYNPRAHKMNKNKTGSAVSASARKIQRQRARTV
jgi:hypothetical protein